MLYVHRWASILAGLVILYIAITGLWMQSMDLFVQVSNQPVTDPTYQEFHQHLNGPNNYAVISDPDYMSKSLPTDLDTIKAFDTVARAARAAAPGAPMRLVELRMIGEDAAGRVKMGNESFLFNALTGERLPDTWLPPSNPNAITPGLRSNMKSWHKFAFTHFLLQKASILNFLAGMAVCVLAVTGTLQYFRLLKVRRRIGKPELFWSTRGLWRKLHRWAAVVFGVVILYLVVTGMLMAVSDLGAAYAEWKSPRDSRPINPDTGDYSTPLTDRDIPAMTDATLAAFHRVHLGVPIKVLQLRYFAHYSQGVVVTGEKPPRQHVYDTRDGREMSETEPGYPVGNFPFGWQWHQNVKRFHRGDIVGLGGNWLEWLSGVGLLYFAASGIWMYIEMWRRRASTGRRSVMWR